MMVIITKSFSSRLAALFMKCHNKSELTPVCSYRARFLGARWVLCDYVSVDYFISYIWDSKWLPRTPQEGGTPSQLGNLPSPETRGSRGDKASSSQAKHESSHTPGPSETLLQSSTR